MNVRTSLILAAALGVLSGGVAWAQSPAPAVAAEKKFVPYRITRGDILSISVLGESDLTVGQKRVESTGTINLAYVGDVRLVGLTLKEAQELLQKAYIDGRVLRSPTINVVVDQYAPRVVRISGMVNQQGPIELPPDGEMTIAELISKAGGFRETARGTAVRVTRTLPDGTTRTEELDVESAIKGKQRRTTGQGAFLLEPGDVVYVPEKVI